MTCRGLSGWLFGHDFVLCHDLTEKQTMGVPPERLLSVSDQWMDDVLRAGTLVDTTKTYRGAVCRRCGQQHIPAGA